MTEQPRYPGPDEDQPAKTSATSSKALWRYAVAGLAVVALLVVLHLTGVVGG